MALRPEYSLGHSQYNDFLFASVGEETGDAQLTVLSALTRLGFDPWQEAARLSDMPRDVAARGFATTLAGLPDRHWTTADVRALAARLVDRLPERSAPPIPTLKDAPSRGDAGKSRLKTWVMWAVLAALLLFAVLHLQAGHEFEPAHPTQLHSNGSH